MVRESGLFHVHIYIYLLICSLFHRIRLVYKQIYLTHRLYPRQVLLLWVTVNLWVMKLNGYSTRLRDPELDVAWSDKILCYTQDTFFCERSPTSYIQTPHTPDTHRQTHTQLYVCACVWINMYIHMLRWIDHSITLHILIRTGQIIMVLFYILNQIRYKEKTQMTNNLWEINAFFIIKLRTYQ